MITRLVADLKELGDALRHANLGSDAEQIETAAHKLQRLQSDMLPIFDRLLVFGQIGLADLQPARAMLKDSAGSDDIERVFQRLERIVEEIRQQSGNAKPITDLISPLEIQIDDAKSALAAAAANPDASSVDDVQNSIDQLIVGFGELVPATASRIVAEIKRIEQPLIDANFGTQAIELGKGADKLAPLQKEARRRLQNIKRSSPELKARRDIGFAARSLETVFRELNLIAVSPAIMFDAARIGPQTDSDQGGVRYGLGPAVRFSLVTLDITMGYSWNLHRRPGEGRGAFVFSMNISDLFR